MSAVNISETTIYQPVVVKTLANQEQLIRELLRSVVVGFYQSGSSPLGICGNRLMFNKIQGTNLRDIWGKITLEQQEDLLKQLVQQLVEIKERYQQSDQTLLKRLNLDLDWGSFMSKNQRYLLTLNQSLIFKLKPDLDDLDGVQDLTLTHGDLGLSNILLSGTSLKLIDFEHTVEAPLEFDLAPSFFWRDDNSLPLEKINKIFDQEYRSLDQGRFTKLVSLYLVNQLRLADLEGDQEKYQQLLTKAYERNLL